MRSESTDVLSLNKEVGEAMNHNYNLLVTWPCSLIAVTSQSAQSNPTPISHPPGNSNVKNQFPFMPCSLHVYSQSCPMLDLSVCWVPPKFRLKLNLMVVVLRDWACRWLGYKGGVLTIEVNAHTSAGLLESVCPTIMSEFSKQGGTILEAENKPPADRESDSLLLFGPPLF